MHAPKGVGAIYRAYFAFLSQIDVYANEHNSLRRIRNWPRTADVYGTERKPKGERTE